MENLIKCRFKLSILFWAIFIINSFPQTKIDSLKQVLSSKAGDDRIPILISLCKENLFTDPIQSEKYAEEAVSLSQKLGDDFKLGDAYYNLGYSKYRLGEYSNALIDLNSALDYFFKAKAEGPAASAKILMAILNNALGRYEISVQLYSELLPYYKSKNMMKEYSKMLMNISTIYSEKGDFDIALENLFETQKIAETYANDDKSFIGDILCNIGEAYFGKKNYDLALKYRKWSLEVFEKINLIDGIAYMQSDIGSTYLQMKDFQQAKRYFNQALINYKKIKYNIGIMQVKESIIRYYKSTNRPDNALAELKDLVKLSLAAKDSVMLSKCFNHYADVYYMKNDNLNAAVYFKKFIDLKNIIDAEENKQKIIGMQTLFVAEQKDSENKSLREENDLQKSRLRTNYLIVFFTAIGLLIFSILLFLLFRKEKSLKKNTELLERKNEEINIQNKKQEEMILAKDKFFSILAHNLKNPFWSILGLNNLLGKNYKDLTDDERMELILCIGNSAENVYKLFENLLSWAKTQQSAITPLKENLNAEELILNSIKPYEVRAKNKNVSIETIIRKDIIINGDKFMLETVIGNLVDNAIKFSKTDSNVIVSVYENNNNTQISIKDAGLGIPQEKIDKLFKIDENISTEGTLKEKGTGLGLIICYEFVKLHNGKIVITSALNEGAVFTIILPKE